jgi:hypothetical protein
VSRLLDPPEFAGEGRRLVADHIDRRLVVGVIAVEYVECVVLSQPRIEIAPDFSLRGGQRVIGAAGLGA